MSAESGVSVAQASNETPAASLEPAAPAPESLPQESDGQSAAAAPDAPGAVGPEPMTPEAAARIVEEAKAYRTPDNWQGLLFHYVLNNGAPKDKNIRSVARVLEVAQAFDHHLWPLELRDMVAGKDVLDFGCGATLHGPVFRALGAKTYTGVDRSLDHAKKKFRSRRTKTFETTGFTFTDVSRLLPGVSYFRGDKVTSVSAFDLVLMQSVTHRALDLEALLQQLHRALRPNGRIWINHMNYHSWSGHQRVPKAPGSYNPNDPAQAALADWRHVSAMPEDLKSEFNAVRLTDVRRMIDRLFDVEQWSVVREKKIVEGRLTPQVRATLTGYTDAELLIKSVTCVATKKSD